MTADNKAESQRGFGLKKLLKLRKRSPVSRVLTFVKPHSNGLNSTSRTSTPARDHNGSASTSGPSREDDAVAGATDPSATLRTHDLAVGKAGQKAGPSYNLADGIAANMEKNQVGLQDRSNYLPDEALNSLVTTASIRDTLLTASEDLIGWIETNARKTFALTVLAIPEQPRRLEAMETFRHHKFSDVYLPVKNLLKHCECDWEPSSRTACGNECNLDAPRICRKIHKSRLDCFHHSVWTFYAFQIFHQAQWRLVLQPFHAKILKGTDEDRYELPVLQIEQDRLLPFLPSEQFKEKVEGNFGLVQPARMLRDFQNVIGNAKQGTIDIAIKTLRDVDDQEFDIDKEWWREVGAHRSLGELDKDHLVQAIAAYQHRGQYCLIFEWADGGNLRNYWNTTDHPGLSANMILEHLHQLRGLTGALHKMHRTKEARSRRQSRSRSRTASSVDSGRSTSLDLRRTFTTSSDALHFSDYTEDEDTLIQEATVPSASPQIFLEPTQESLAPQVPELVLEQPGGKQVRPSSPNFREDENWRHGDVKPENILRFGQSSSDLGVLKLADLGRAKRHLLVTSNRPVQEQDEWRTKPYEPPDLYVNRSEKGSMSRLFDVWSLGCVFFESIVWMLHGKRWLQEFAFTNSVATQGGTPFWIRNGDDFTVSPIVRNCMTHMFTKDPECSGSMPSAIRDLLSLVRDKMLVIGLPARTDTYESEKRANTETILQDLDSILEKSKVDTYLFTGGSRLDLEPLKKPRRATPDAPSMSADGVGVDEVRPAASNSLALPESSGVGASRTSRLNTYSRVPQDRWLYQNDDAFALRVYQKNKNLYDPDCLSLADQVLCRFCQHRDFREGGLLLTRKISQLEHEKLCALCKILLNRCRGANLNSVATITLHQLEAGLVIRSIEGDISYNPNMRLCRSLARDTTQVGRIAPFMPLGLPKLPEITSAATFSLLSSWLDDCDHQHGERNLDCVSNMSAFYPKRLLDVGTSIDSSDSRIVESHGLEALGAIKYLALSHPWGKNTSVNPHFVSNIHNIAQHMKSIPDTDLPQNFKDAVVVARHLDIRYLWIDALCILQKTRSHPGDFQQEAGCMQDIFSSAYCVLAASSATGMNSGFLRSGSRIPRQARLAAEVNVGNSDDSLVLCDSPDDFQRDVIKGNLSTRAWVLQERALARRTIFFTRNQIYWECSDGVRCESMSKLKNSGAALLGDSNFPTSLVSEDKTKGAQIYLFEKLYADYCRLSFSRSTDKPFAIAGLEQRLSEQFLDVSGAGIFGKHKGRCLLWMRADDVKSLDRIDFHHANPGTHIPPSWSFMAYTGGITYLEIPGKTVSWDHLDLKLTGSAKTLWLYAKEPLTFQAYAIDFEVRAKPDLNKWLIVYDNPEWVRYDHKCVVIGSVGDELLYVLVVKPIMGSPNGIGRAPYERVGAGYIPKGWIRGEKIAIKVQ